MTIVIINDNAQVNGGATKIAILNARDLANQGHTVYFLCAVLPVGPELQNHPRIKVICSEQFEILNNPNRLQALAQGWWNFKAQRMARELFSSLDPETTVVHLHLWAKALSSSVVREAVAAKLPIICTLHDFLLACPTGTLFHHKSTTICELQPMQLPCIRCNCDTRNYSHKLWRVGRQAIQQQLGLLPGSVRRYIAHSKLVARVMEPHLPPNSVIHHIPAYIETTQDGPASPADNEGFVYVGRLVREKGVLLLAAASMDAGTPITFVGAGELAAEVAAIHPSASITGWVNHGQAVAHLRQSRALVFPSLWYETLGLVVLEAASHGIPSIVSDTSAACEMVLDGVTGLHFRNGDVEDLRRKMVLLQDPALAAQLGREAYDRFWASSFASGAAHLGALEFIYHSALEQTQADMHRFTTLSSGGIA